MKDNGRRDYTLNSTTLGLTNGVQFSENVGLVTSGGWSFTLNKSVVLAYVRSDLATPGTKLEIEVFGERRTATVGREPLYDPENGRLRA